MLLAARRLVLVLTAFALLVPAPAGAAAPLPPGAVKLSKDRLKAVGGVRCGKVGGKWLSGTVLRRRYFISHARQSRNLRRLAHRSRSDRRRRLQRQARILAAKARRHTPRCARTVPVARPAPAPTSTSPVSSTPAPPAPLRFDLSGSVGLALRADGGTTRMRSASTASASNLKAVAPTGAVRDAVSSGTAPIRKFHVAPDGRTYVLFATRVNIADTNRNGFDGGCLLAEITAADTPACVDNSLSSVQWTNLAGVNPAIQFDATGAVYYSGYTATGTSVLRRHHAGITTDLVNDNIMIRDFLVVPNGDVFVSGSTSSTGATWVRRIAASGGLQSLRSTTSNFLRLFPDGNVYFGLWGGSDWGVRRYLTESRQVEGKYWIGSAINGQPADAYFDAATYCPPEHQTARQGFCGSNGSFIRSSLQLSDGSVYVLAGSGSDALFMQYHPTVRVPATAVQKVTVAEAVGRQVVLTGRNAQDANVMTVHDPSTDSEAVLLGPDNEIEVYRINRVANENKVMFDGLRFADNTYVIGQVDLATRHVSLTTSAKWDDFQTFR